MRKVEVFPVAKAANKKHRMRNETVKALNEWSRNRNRSRFFERPSGSGTGTCQDSSHDQQDRILPEDGETIRTDK